MRQTFLQPLRSAYANSHWWHDSRSSHFDPDFDGYVSYSVDDPLVAPMDLTYGPKNLDLIR